MVLRGGAAAALRSAVGQVGAPCDTCMLPCSHERHPTRPPPPLLLAVPSHCHLLATATAHTRATPHPTPRPQVVAGVPQPDTAAAAGQVLACCSRGVASLHQPAASTNGNGVLAAARQHHQQQQLLGAARPTTTPTGAGAVAAFASSSSAAPPAAFMAKQQASFAAMPLYPKLLGFGGARPGPSVRLSHRAHSLAGGARMRYGALSAYG